MGDRWACTSSPATTSRSFSARSATCCKQLVGDGDRTLMVDDFDSDDYELRAVVDAAQTPPFLTDRRVVVARGVGRFKADDVAPLVAYLGDPLPSTDLVLVGGGGRLPKALTDAVKGAGGTSIETAAPTRAKERAGWFEDQIRASGLKLEPQAVQRLAEWLGEDAGRLQGILETLQSTYGNGKTLRVADVSPVPRRCRRRAAVGPHRRHRPAATPPARCSCCTA